MEKLKLAVDKLDSTRLREIHSLLGLTGSPTKNKLHASLASLTGLNSLLSSLSPEELDIINLLSEEKNGLIFSDILKNLKMSIEMIEELTERLQQKMLIYVFKNRKHLNNRFDKAYIFPQIFDLIQKYNTDPATLLKSVASQNAKAEKRDDIRKIRDKSGLLKDIYSHGSIVTLGRVIAETDTSKQKINALIEEFVSEGLIHISLVVSHPFATIIILDHSVSAAFCAVGSSTASDIFVRNRYTALINTLHAYDVIKSNGLFFTQQSKFRKTDLKKLLQEMIPLHGIDGTRLSEEETLQLSLFFLDVLDCTRVTKTNIFTTLSPIKRYLHSPEKLTEILQKSFTKNISNENFSSPITIPHKNHCDYVKKYLRDNPSVHFEELKLDFIFHFTSHTRNFIQHLDNTVKNLNKSFISALQFLACIGIVNRTNATLQLETDHHSSRDENTMSPTIYINPDFTLIIPGNDTPPAVQYTLLAFSTLEKNDVTINTHVTKESVLNAYKRGMKARVLTETLEKHAKNDLPQNMTFLIHEWIKQSLNLTVNFGTILEVNHRSFIDELEYKVPDSVTRRLSETCAIVSREKVDEIVKLGEKHKALIRIELIE